jgi:hypothetical protein
MMEIQGEGGLGGHTTLRVQISNLAARHLAAILSGVEGPVKSISEYC